MAETVYNSKNTLTIGAFTYTSLSAPTVVGSTALYGTLAGSNTVAASTVSATSLVGTHYGVLAGSNTVAASTVSATSIVGTHYGALAGSNTVSATSGTFSGNVGIGTTNPGQALHVIGNVQIGSGSGDYRQFILGGGNSSGYLYGCFAKYGDGIHLGYNFYNNNTNNVIPNAAGTTSRLSLGYGTIAMYTGGTNAEPTNLGYYQDSTGKVGIGTTNPGVQLQIGGAGVTGNVLQIGNFTFQMVSYQSLFGAGTVTYTPSSSGIFVAFYASDTMVFTSSGTVSGQYSAVTTYMNSATLTGNGGLGQLSLSTAVNGVLTATFKATGDIMRVFRMAF